MAFVLLAALAVARGSVPSAERFAGVPWWAWTGGALGCVYVWTALWSVGRLGVVTMVAALILGQMAAALLLDMTSAFGLAARCHAHAACGSRARGRRRRAVAVLT